MFGAHSLGAAREGKGGGGGDMEVEAFRQQEGQGVKGKPKTSIVLARPEENGIVIIHKKINGITNHYGKTAVGVI